MKGAHNPLRRRKGKQKESIIFLGGENDNESQ